MAFADAAMASAASDGGGAYWNTASGMFGGQLDPEPEPQPSELAGELRALLAERGHDTDMADELCTISGWHNLSGQRLWEQSTTRHYSDAQKKLLLEQAAGAGDSVALVAPSGLPQGMPAEIVRAIAASESIRQAWKGVLDKPQFRRLMAELREPRAQAAQPVAPEESSQVAAVSSAAGTEQARSLGAELSALAEETGVAPPPPGWRGWQQEQQPLTTSSPTFMVLSYIFPEDKVQIVYVSGSTEHVAWSVPWASIRAKPNKSQTVSLVRKPDEVYMVGVDKLHWTALLQVRRHAQASERAHLASQLHCDTSMMVYPQRSLLAQNRSRVASSASISTSLSQQSQQQSLLQLQLPVGMERSSRSSMRGRMGGSMLRNVRSQNSSSNSVRGGDGDSMTAQSLQSLREGSLPAWYFNAMRVAVAERSETAIASLLRMAESYELSSQENLDAAAAGALLPSRSRTAGPGSEEQQEEEDEEGNGDSSQLMSLVPSRQNISSEWRTAKPHQASESTDKILLLPTADEWVARSPRLTSAPPSHTARQQQRPASSGSAPGTIRRVGGGFQRSVSQQGGGRITSSPALHRMQQRGGGGGGGGGARSLQDVHEPAATTATTGGTDEGQKEKHAEQQDDPTFVAAGANEGAVGRRAMGTLATTRPATTTGSLRPRLPPSPNTARRPHSSHSGSRSRSGSRSNARSPRSQPVSPVSPGRGSGGSRGRSAKAGSYHPQMPRAPPRSAPTASTARRRHGPPKVTAAATATAGTTTKDQMRARRRVAAEKQLAQLEAAANRRAQQVVNPLARAAEDSSGGGGGGGGGESKSRPVSRVDSPPTGFLYGAF